MADDDLRKLSYDLKRASGRVGQLASAVIRKAALDVQREAQRLAPVDTGTLRASIGIDVLGDGRAAAMSAVIGPSVHYGPYLEFGTRRMPPQPYMGPAADRVLPAFEEAMAQIVDRALDD